MTTGYIIDIEFVWGHITNIAGMTKTTPPHPYPPPTTILGAIASVISKEYLLGEKNYPKLIIELAKNTLSLTMKPLNYTPVVHEDINRIVTIKLTSGQKYPKPSGEGSFDAPARGKTIVSPMENGSPILRVVYIIRSDFLNINGKKIEINADTLWKITRIGAKETTTSVINVEEHEAQKVSPSELVTTYSFPKNNNIKIIDQEGSWIIANYVSPYLYNSWEKSPSYSYIVGKGVETFLIPQYKIEQQAWARITASKPYVGYEIKNEIVIGVE